MTQRSTPRAVECPVAERDILDALLAVARVVDEGVGVVETPAQRGRFATRWTPVVEFERDGQRYVLARAADRTTRFAGLSRREMQVMGSAARGDSTNVIAYELGIAASTVRVLLSRVRIKLGVSNSAEAIRMWAHATPANDP